MSEKDLRYTKEFIPEITSYDPINHTMVFWITSPKLDAHGERINPDGVKFEPHPKFLLNHNWNSDPIGGIKWVGREGAKWKAMVEYDQDDPIAIMQEKKYAKGYKTDCSIGFLTNLNAITRDESNNPVHNDILVKEISLVTFGANGDAVAKSDFTIEELDEMSKNAISTKVKTFFESVKNEKIVEDKIKETRQEDIVKIEEKLKDFESKLEMLAISYDNIFNSAEFVDGYQAEVQALSEEVKSIKEILNNKVISYEKAIIKSNIKELVALEINKILKKV